MKALILTIILATNVLNLEVMSTKEQKELGLMNRRSWGSIDGMIFINDEPEAVAYWMKNTYLNLTLYYLDEDMSIIEQYNPVPLSARIIQSTSENIKYVLEINPAMTNYLIKNYALFRKKALDKLADLTNK